MTMMLTVIMNTKILKQNKKENPAIERGFFIIYR